MRARGLEPGTVVLSATEIEASDETAKGLRVPKGTKVIRVERLRTADASPMAYEIGYYPSALFPGRALRIDGSQQLTARDRTWGLIAQPCLPQA